MKKLAILLIAALLCTSLSPVGARTSPPGRRATQSGPEQGLAELLDLWRESKFDELYARVVLTGKQSKESFLGALSSSRHKPACCWEKLQEVRVTAQDEWYADIQAKVGLEGMDGTVTFSTRRFRMRKQDGMWKVLAADLLPLAGKGKNRHRLRYTQTKGKVS